MEKGAQLYEGKAKKIYATDGVYLFGLKDQSLFSFVAAVLNSKLFTFLYRLISLETGRTLAQVKPKIIEQIAFPKKDSEAIKKFGYLVNEMQKIKKSISTSKTPAEKTALQRQIDATDKQIDQLVYQLYGLTEEEIKIVEGE